MRWSRIQQGWPTKDPRHGEVTAKGCTFSLLELLFMYVVRRGFLWWSRDLLYRQVDYTTCSVFTAAVEQIAKSEMLQRRMRWSSQVTAFCYFVNCKNRGGWTECPGLFCSMGFMQVLSQVTTWCCIRVTFVALLLWSIKFGCLLFIYMHADGQPETSREHSFHFLAQPKEISDVLLRWFVFIIWFEYFSSRTAASAKHPQEIRPTGTPREAHALMAHTGGTIDLYLSTWGGHDSSTWVCATRQLHGRPADTESSGWLKHLKDYSVRPQSFFKKVGSYLRLFGKVTYEWCCVIEYSVGRIKAQTSGFLSSPSSTWRCALLDLK